MKLHVCSMLTFHTDFKESTSSQYRCKNNRCIARTHLCDGVDNCRDGNATDEIGCREYLSLSLNLHTVCQGIILIF